MRVQLSFHVEEVMICFQVPPLYISTLAEG